MGGRLRRADAGEDVAPAGASGSGYRPIEDYGAIGNSHSLALVSRDGSIDWWCPIRFDDPSVFAAILDAERGGRFAVTPRGTHEVARRYLEGTNVLETSFVSDDGELRMTDFVPLTTDDPSGNLQVHQGIFRELECVRGRVTLDVLYEPRWDYGRVAAELEPRRGIGLFAEHEADALLLRSSVPLEVADGDSAARGRAVLEAGDVARLVLSFARREPLVVPDLQEGARRVRERTCDWWREWSEQTSYEGEYREHVVRSGLVLRMLTYAPSGAIVAAPTTSLPETLGGERNWDYRYCWLRDATMTVRTLLEFSDVARCASFLEWMLHATRRTHPELGILYDVYGESDLEERTLDHLEGYRGSAPVRVGNGAVTQVQLDVYGEVVGAARQFAEHVGPLGAIRSKILRALGETVCRSWREPDHGIWEIRAEPRHHTNSKMQCWRALDDLLAMHEAGYLEVPVDRFREERAAVRAAIEERGWDSELGSYVSWFGGRAVDASLLLLGLHGFVAPDAPRMRGTWERVKGQLQVDGMLRRYDEDYGDGLEGTEGVFGICSFWAAEYLAAAGEVEEAKRWFDAMLERANDVGLYSEELDPRTGAFLGNFPQAFTHLGLMGAALSIDRAERAADGRSGGRARREER